MPPCLTKYPLASRFGKVAFPEMKNVYLPSPAKVTLLKSSVVPGIISIDVYESVNTVEKVKNDNLMGKVKKTIRMGRNVP